MNSKRAGTNLKKVSSQKREKEPEKVEKEKVEKTEKVPKSAISSFKRWHIVDSILFMAFIMIVSLMMVLTGLAQESHEIPSFTMTDEYAGQLNLASLSGTLPRVNYTDRAGQDTVYMDWSVKQLLIEDLKIRLAMGPYKAPADIGSLQKDIEGPIGSLLDDLVGPSRTFVLNVSAYWPGDTAADEFFNIFGNGYSSRDDGSDHLSKNTITLELFDSGSGEVGEMKVKIELKIYQIST